MTGLQHPHRGVPGGVQHPRRPVRSAVWASTLMTPLVDSGELLPMCWPCHRKTGRSVTIHDREIDELTRLGRLEEGWQVIAEMNSATSGEHS